MCIGARDQDASQSPLFLHRQKLRIQQRVMLLAIQRGLRITFLILLLASQMEKLLRVFRLVFNPAILGTRSLLRLSFGSPTMKGIEARNRRLSSAMASSSVCKLGSR